MTERVNGQFTRTINERRLLNLIREAGPISRNDLAKRTNISKSAVSYMISSLEEDGYILETGKGTSTRKGGKKPILLKLNADNGYVVGIHVTRGAIQIALANLKSEIRESRKLRFDITSSIDPVLEKICFEIDGLLAGNRLPEEKLVGIAIAIPGFIDYEKGELKYSVTLKKWINVPLAEVFQEYYRVPTILENDVNAVTLSESIHGAGRGESNLVCLFLESGIGAGIILNNQIVRGETSHPRDIGYMELGHALANIHYLENLYNNQRFFGEVLSEVNLLDTLKVKLHSDQSDHGVPIEQMTLNQILPLAEEGHPVVQEVLNEYAYPLATLCMTFIKLLNPGRLVLCGHIIEGSKYLYHKVKQLVKQSMINIPIDPSPIAVGTLSEMAGVDGAVALALETIFCQPLQTGVTIMNPFGLNQKNEERPIHRIRDNREKNRTFNSIRSEKPAALRMKES